MHYYKFNIKDWTRDTAHLSVEEEGVYRRLLDHYYESEQPISAETHSVVRRLRLAGHEASLGIILSEFFSLESDGYHHGRCDIEIAKYQAKAEANRGNGRFGGRPRKPIENPDGFENEPTNNLNHKPLTTNQEPEEIKNTCAQDKPERVKSVTVKQLVGMGVDEQHAKDWLAVRKTKRAPLTPTALAGVQREADKAGITLAQAIERAANNNWAGFKASWQEVNHGTNTGGGRQGSPSLVEQVREHNRRAEAARECAEPGADASVVAVDGEVVGTDDQHVWPQMDLGARTGGR